MPLRGASGPGEIARAMTSAPSSRSTTKRGTPSPITICERSVTSAVNLSKSTTTPFGAERDDVADRHVARLGRRREPQLRPLQVEQQAERAPGARGRLAHGGRAAAQVVVVAVRAVQTRAVEPRGDESVEHARRIGGGAQRRHDLRAPLQHVTAECCIEPPRGAVRRNPGRISHQQGEVGMRRVLGLTAVCGMLAFAGTAAAQIPATPTVVDDGPDGGDGHQRAQPARADGVDRRQRLPGAREADGPGQARAQRRHAGGRPRSDRQLRVRARPARHRARQVLPPQRLRLPLLERDDAAGRQQRHAGRARDGQPARPLQVERLDADLRQDAACGCGRSRTTRATASRARQPQRRRRARRPGRQGLSDRRATPAAAARCRT